MKGRLMSTNDKDILRSLTKGKLMKRGDKLFALHPGYVISINDQDMHYITAEKLIKLYKIDPRKCVVWHESMMSQNNNYIHLHPQRDIKKYQEFNEREAGEYERKN